MKRAVTLGMIGLAIVAAGALMIANKHHLYAEVIIGAIGVSLVLVAGLCFLDGEIKAAIGFVDLGLLLIGTAFIMVALHHGWILESVIGGIGFAFLFWALISVEIHPEKK